ncbi:MAG: hypothetical protein CMH64_02725 [Nanoarchaeota archaeon]|nr:hypothetical protein [Nanoarchaeota archaeon]|tara:strand:- start:3208 stop:3483 length:276 start_codon:yes stop_codon:yes gene_type:complete
MARTYVDEYGYLRYVESDLLIHRAVARTHIWAPNSEKYTLPFEDYEVHHKDENKMNNEIWNLEVLTEEEHMRRHGYKRNKVKKGRIPIKRW